MRGLIDRDKYLTWIIKNPPHLFNEQWWLDAVAPNRWDAVVINDGDEVVAAMPYFIQKKYGISYIGMPFLTQKMGPIMKHMEFTCHTEKISYQNKIFKEIIKSIPSVSHFHQNFDYSITNWLPFYWAGYEQTTRYTYILNSINNHESVLAGFSDNKLKPIKKAKSKIKILFDLDPTKFYSHLKNSFRIQNQKITYSYNQFFAIYSAVYKANKGKSLYAIDEKGEIYCALLIAWDHLSAYNLITFINRKYSSSGASSLLFEEAIKYSAKFCSKFDFEGSMSEEIERSYRHFGATQTPYFSIRKNSGFYKKYLNLRSLFY